MIEKIIFKIFFQTINLKSFPFDSVAFMNLKKYYFYLIQLINIIYEYFITLIHLFLVFQVL
jgi:hypothetical protein